MPGHKVSSLSCTQQAACESQTRPTSAHRRSGGWILPDISILVLLGGWFGSWAAGWLFGHFEGKRTGALEHCTAWEDHSQQHQKTSGMMDLWPLCLLRWARASQLQVSQPLNSQLLSRADVTLRQHLASWVEQTYRVFIRTLLHFSTRSSCRICLGQFSHPTVVMVSSECRHHLRNRIRGRQSDCKQRRTSFCSQSTLGAS
jgi:hypothetical protein